MAKLNNTKQTDEVRYISGDIKDKNDLQEMYSRVVALFKLKEAETKVICHAVSEVSEISLCRLANLCDSKIELDYMLGKITFTYNLVTLKTERAEIKDKVEETSAFNKAEDLDDYPF